MERWKYDVINEPFKEKVDAQVLGKTSTLEKDIDEEASGVSTQGNKKFLQKAKDMNKFDNDNKGVGNREQAVVQLGSNIAPGAGHPGRSKNPFESTQKVNENKCNGSCIRKVGDDWRVVSGKTGKLWPQKYDTKESAEDALKAYHVQENKVKVGEIFTETKHNLKLKFTGLNEDKTKLNFIDESSNKKYTLMKENFKKGLNEGVLLRQNYEEGMEQQQNNQRFESKNTKRLNFKKDNFICESHMFTLIPEDYKVHGNRFYMKDASENEYLIEWNDKLKQKAVILEHKNEKKLNENMSRMKDLWNYNSLNTTKPLNEQERVSEKQNLGNFIQKVKEVSKKND